jgi:acyl-[acyl carrier protein]--UDP-N-acetylglucosamine O-acyltransferase
LIYRSKLNTRQAIEAVRNQIEPREEILQLLEFIEKSERGIIRQVIPTEAEGSR